jgi:hypothetical protein
MRNTRAKGKIIVSGILFWYPLAGVTYQFLHYLIGLRRLGYQPYYIEDSARLVYNPRINDLTVDPIENVETIAPTLEAYGFGQQWAFRGHYPESQSYGMAGRRVSQLYREADAFLNVTGGQELRDDHLSCRRRIYVESDPFWVQVGVASGHKPTIRTLQAYDALFSFGENLGAPDCDVPVEPFRWLPTRQPVALDVWDNKNGTDPSAYTTITTWRNTGRDIVYQGETYYWTKDREFLKVLDLPRRRSVRFELAVWADEQTEHLLSRHGWRRAPSVEISSDVSCYRSYIQRSRGEFTVARDQYVRPRTGWFSDRSVCYLAAGRPVITQETGFSKFIPTGRGLFAFETMEDILRAVDAIEADYESNCRAARELAAEYFAAEKVVGSLLTRAGL